MDLDDLFERRRGHRGSRGHHAEDHHGHGDDHRHHDDHKRWPGTYAGDHRQGTDWGGHGSHGGHQARGSILASAGVQRLLRSPAAWIAVAVVTVLAIAVVVAVGWGLAGYVRVHGLRGLVEAALGLARVVWQGSGGGPAP